MNLRLIVVALGVTALLSGQATALTLLNDDDVSHNIEVAIGEGDATIETFALDSGEARGDLCDTGCILKLDNGTEQQFNGDEDVVIQDGDFVIAE